MLKTGELMQRGDVRSYSINADTALPAPGRDIDTYVYPQIDGGSGRRLVRQAV